ncbi:DUF5959 family protein [Myceligenerans crystallogenes]|uniref:tRNA adenosine deaminase-associated protein n=1 Tax=Myceligenerans crystallogenes TaxID=316335 RepID=A0ABP4ZT18_9MICO
MTLSLPYTLAVFRGGSIRIALEVTELGWNSAQEVAEVGLDIAIEGEELTYRTSTGSLADEELLTFQGFLDELDRGSPAVWEPSERFAELAVELGEDAVSDTDGAEPWVTVKPHDAGLVVGGAVTLDDEWFDDVYARFDALQDHLEELRAPNT